MGRTLLSAALDVVLVFEVRSVRQAVSGRKSEEQNQQQLRRTGVSAPHFEMCLIVSRRNRASPHEAWPKIHHSLRRSRSLRGSAISSELIGKVPRSNHAHDMRTAFVRIGRSDRNGSNRLSVLKLANLTVIYDRSVRNILVTQPDGEPRRVRRGNDGHSHRKPGSRGRRWAALQARDIVHAALLRILRFVGSREAAPFVRRTRCLARACGSSVGNHAAQQGTGVEKAQLSRAVAISSEGRRIVTHQNAVGR